jgi:hypothetical protein
MEEYIQKELWTEEEYASSVISTAQEISELSMKKKTDAASLWLSELGKATQVKQLLAMADCCDISISKEQPTYWYTLRYVLSLRKKDLEARIEVEQDSPYEKVRIMDIWVKSSKLN